MLQHELAVVFGASHRLEEKLILLGNSGQRAVEKFVQCACGRKDWPSRDHHDDREKQRLGDKLQGVFPCKVGAS